MGTMHRRTRFESLHFSRSSLEAFEDEGGSHSLEEASRYLSTSHPEMEKSTSTLRSLFPPSSFPSKADLGKDSDVYPQNDATTIENDDSNITLYPSDDEFVRKKISSCEATSSTSSTSSSSFSFLAEDDDVTFSDHESDYSPSEESNEEMEECESLEDYDEFSSSKDICEPAYDIVDMQHFIILPIQPQVMPKLCFDENLHVSYYNKLNETVPSIGLEEWCPSESLGSVNISIQKTGADIVIYSKSDFWFEGKKASSSIVSMVDEFFELIEERRTEVLEDIDGRKEKSLHVVREMNDYKIFRSSAHNENVRETKDLMNLAAEGNMILDGANFLLMRYLIKSKFQGTLETWTMHLSGQICRSVYLVGKRKPMKVNNRSIQSIRIVRVIFRKSYPPSVSKTYFLPTGHILRHQWKDCDYLLHMNPFTWTLPPCKYLDSLENDWEKDICLKSQYLDMKDEIKADIKSYISDNNVIMKILTDYLVFLLEHKPSNILDFTIEYFHNLYCELSENDRI